MKYYQAENYGKGFITHKDNELAHIAGYPGNIWVTTNTEWATRVGAVEKTKAEAQANIDTDVFTHTLGQSTIYVDKDGLYFLNVNDYIEVGIIVEESDGTGETIIADKSQITIHRIKY